MIVKVTMQALAAGLPATISDHQRVILRLIATGPLLARMRGKLCGYFHADVSEYEIELGDSAPAEAW